MQRIIGVSSVVLIFYLFEQGMFAVAKEISNIKLCLSHNKPALVHQYDFRNANLWGCNGSFA